MLGLVSGESAGRRSGRPTGQEAWEYALAFKSPSQFPVAGGAFGNCLHCGESTSILMKLTGVDIMQVQVVHESENGLKTDLGVREMEHLPPIAMPFPIEKNLYYRTKAYFGPDDSGLYLLVLEGEPRLAR